MGFRDVCESLARRFVSVDTANWLVAKLQQAESGQLEPIMCSLVYSVYGV